MADKFKLSRKAKKIILGACIGGVVVLTAGLFTYIHIADTNTLGRKVSIYGMDVSTLTIDKAEQKLLDAFRSRKVQFKEGGSDVYQTTLSELGYDLDESALKSELTELQTTREANRKIFATQEDYKIAYQIQKDEEQEKKTLQEMADEHAIAETSEGSFEWTQEMTDQYIAEYEQTLEDIKNGLLVSKSVNGDDECMTTFNPNWVGSTTD